MLSYEEQKREKKPIDDLIEELLEGEEKDSIKEFLAFLREYKMNPSWGAKNSYNLSYKGKRVCIIKMAKGEYELRLNTQYDDLFNSEFEHDKDENRLFLIEQVRFCFGCGTCKPGITMKILGESMKNLCFNPVINMKNPNASKIDMAKRLVLLRRKEISFNRAPRVTYIGASKR